MSEAGTRLEAEILALRHQINILRRNAPKRVQLGNLGRLILVTIYRLAPATANALAVVKPATVIRLHRLGFRAYWRWRSRSTDGCPKIRIEVRRLIRQMSLDNPLWGAPRIHGELLKLGIDVGQTSVAKYMARWQRPPNQGWKTFLLLHASGIAAIDLFVVPTVAFRLLYGLVIVRLARRLLGWTAVTAELTAEWIVRQITEAFPWGTIPRYLIRNRDTVYGLAFKKRVHAMGIRDHPIAPRSPWQNPFAERLIGSIRRECLGPYRGRWCWPPAPDPSILHGLLQPGSNSSLAKQGLPHSSTDPGDRDNRLGTCSCSWRLHHHYAQA
jgi:hypothetical protein